MNSSVWLATVPRTKHCVFVLTKIIVPNKLLID